VIDPRIEYTDFATGAEVSEEFKARFCGKPEEEFRCPLFAGNFRPLSVDITVQDLSMSENVGLRTTQYIQQSLGYYPLLGDLVILFKTYLASLGLNNSYKGSNSLPRRAWILRHLSPDHRLSGVQKKKQEG
jgi:hypothetical protein